MTVLVRKLANRRNVDNIRDSSCVDDIPADAVSEEFRTRKNTLSVWETDNDNLDLGILAISLSSSRIETMDFIILDKNLVEDSGLHIEQTEPENNPLKQANSIHRDISELRLQDFSRLARVYQNTAADETNIVRFTKAQLKDKIGRALKNGWIEPAKASEEIKKIIDSIAS